MGLSAVGPGSTLVRMDAELARDLLTDGFERVRGNVAAVLDGLDGDALLYRPDSEANSIAWLVWHLARIQDDHVAGIAEVLAGARPPERGSGHTPGGQAWHDGGWAERFALHYGPEATGYGQDPDDVARFGVADPAVLGGYQAEAHRRTLDLLGGMDSGAYTSVVDRRWDPPVTAAVRLMSVLDDATQHIGQAAYVRGLAERANAGRNPGRP